MDRPRLCAAFAAALCLGLTVSGLGHAAAATGDNPRQPIYIEDFQVEPAQNGASSGLLSQLGASRRAEKVEENASALSQALVRALNARGVAAYRLSGQEPAPRTGWMISGVFSETVPHGLFSQLSSLGSSTPNTEVKVSVVSLGRDAGGPADTISTAASLKGQGSAISFNPYVAAAKFVVNHAESDSSIDALAKKIADEVLARQG